MALKAVHVSDVPNLDQVPENAALAISSTRLPKGVDAVRVPFKPQKFAVIGHRGSGMNMLYSPDRRMKAIKENSILSFNAAAKFALDFVEFDVQVTRDDCPVIFHDNFILSEENASPVSHLLASFSMRQGTKGCTHRKGLMVVVFDDRPLGSICEKRVTGLTLQEFLTYGPQREPGNVGKSLLRKAKDGRIFNWNVEDDDPLCTLEEAFLKVDASLGFNIELKFDDNIDYQEEELIHVLQVILQVVNEHAKGRPIIFSSFQPDAARLVRKLQSVYPVFFLTNGGTEIYVDVRRNSLEEAMKLVLANGLQGIVSEVKAIFRNPGEIARIKENNLQLLTYGQLNNVPEAVYMQHLMGVDGVIVDLVKEITEAISDFIKPAEEGENGLNDMEEEGARQTNSRPKFSQQELSFLLRLIPELIQV